MIVYFLVKKDDNEVCFLLPVEGGDFFLGEALFFWKLYRICVQSDSSNTLTSFQTSLSQYNNSSITHPNKKTHTTFKGCTLKVEEAGKHLSHVAFTWHTMYHFIWDFNRTKYQPAEMRVWGFPSQGEAQYRRHLLTRSPKPFRSLKIKPHSITCKTLYGSFFIDQLNNKVLENWSSTNIDDTTVLGLCLSLNQMPWVICYVKNTLKYLYS